MKKLFVLSSYCLFTLFALLSLTSQAQDVYCFRSTLKLPETKTIGFDSEGKQLVYYRFKNNSFKHNSVSSSGRVFNIYGYDIIFTDTNGNQLPHYIQNYNPSLGQMELWLRLDTVIADVDNFIYMYYGNPSVTTNQNSMDVFSEYSYFMVNHDTLPSEFNLKNIDNTISWGLNDTAFHKKTDKRSSFAAYSEFLNGGQFSTGDTAKLIGDFTIHISHKFKQVTINNVLDSAGILGHDHDSLKDQSFYLGTHERYAQYGYGDGTEFHGIISTQKIGDNKRNVTSIVRKGDVLYQYYKGVFVDSVVLNQMPDTLTFDKMYNIVGEYTSSYLEKILIRNRAETASEVLASYNLCNSSNGFSLKLQDKRVISYITGADGAANSNSSFIGNASLPSTIERLYVQDSLYLNGNRTIEKLYVMAGAKVVVSDRIRVTDTLSLEGEMTVANAKSLLLTEGAMLVGNGLSRVKRNTGSLKSHYVYQYWSSPVSGETIGDVMVGSHPGHFYSYDAANQSWVSMAPTDIMVPGRGYTSTSVIGMPNNTSTERIFEGKFNNGDIIVAVDSGFNFLGNPYPSVFRNDSFVMNNPLINGTLYLWNQKDNISQQGDYATWNLTGSTKGRSNVSPQNTMPVAQGFFVETSGPGVVTFSNSQRTHNTSNTFFKDSNSLNQNVWLKVRNTVDTAIWQQCLIGLNENATDDYDKLYDGMLYTTNSELNIYTKLNDKKYTIQGLAPFAGELEKSVPFMLYSNDDKTVVLTLDSVNFDLAELNVQILDKYEGKLIDIIHDSITVDLVSGELSDRFELVFTQLAHPDLSDQMNGDENDLTTSVDEVSEEVKVSSLDGTLTVESNVQMTEIKLFDVTGKLILSYQPTSNRAVIRNVQSKVVIVNIETEHGSWSKKIVL